MLRCARAAAMAFALVATACSGGSEPTLPQLDIVVASGDGQFGTAGQVLSDRLQVVVRSSQGAAPKKDVSIRWSVVQGDADFITSPATLTDESGSAYQSVRLGASAGEVRIKATVTDQESVSVSFTLFLVDEPLLQSLSAQQGVAGQSIQLNGLNFSPNPDHNVVLFSGIRGRVTSASTSLLTVEVPSCLASRDVGVTVQLGAVASDSLSLAVVGGDDFTELAPGQFIDVADDGGFTCLRLPGGADVSYLVVAYSASTIAAAEHRFVFTGLVDPSVSSSSGSASAVPGAFGLGAKPTSAAARNLQQEGVQAAFERALRLREARAISSGAHVTSAPVASAQAAPVAAPVKGDRRTFNVFNVDGGFDEVEAVAQYVGEKAVLFVEEVGADDFTEADLAAFARRFDDVIFPTVTGAFGQTSDQDGNERVVILFTATVNRLTPKGAQGFVGGFFYGVDLLDGRQGSNGGEVFYTLIPDPNGAYSDPRPKEKLLEVVPAILAHEFQHMVHFNERLLVLEAEAAEALWLSEGLAQMAEELVARAYDGLGDAEEADLFRLGNRGRIRRYLEAPEAVSLIVVSGQGSLQERGGGVLHVLYLSARGGQGVLGQLTKTTRIGVDNVTQRLGTSWEDLLANWWAATYLDGSGVGGNLEYAGLSLQDFLGETNYTLDPEVLGGSDFEEVGSLWSSSAEYYIVVPSLQGSVTLRLGGGAGGSSTTGAALRWRIVRLP